MIQERNPSYVPQSVLDEIKELFNRDDLIDEEATLVDLVELLQLGKGIGIVELDIYRKHLLMAYHQWKLRKFYHARANRS